MSSKMASKRGREDESDNINEEPPTKNRVVNFRSQDKRLIVVLENANLESVKVGKSYELLNCDDHKNQLKRLNRSPGDCRPDIVHQCLLMLMDSPLNRASKLQVYIHTSKNVLIEIHPQTRIPRTFKRFSGLMVQLLDKFGIRAADGPHKLLKVIKNPVSDYLPAGCKKYSTSFHAKRTVKPRELVPSDEPCVFVIGAMAHGKVNVDYTEEDVSISEYPLSAALTCSKMCSAFEEVWGIH
uniref:18S rRNA (pseudouridine-N1)-methyltransferase n=1 Tax=Strigamia maritima TaxID=126957 RepID=T1J238_STRMM